MLKFRYVLLMSASVVSAIASPAFAQTAPEADASKSDDIVVTALKRDTNLQSTPATVDVIGGGAIADAGITNIENIGAIAPALNFGKANGIYTLVTIRGVSSQDTTELGSPATTFSIDGETINRPLNLAASLFDISRIEVLRGPQGTLYGRNATAGAVNIITVKPVHNFEASVSANVGNYNQYGGQAAINIPIATDVAALRVSGIYSKRDGFTNTEKGRILDDENLLGGRARLLIEPSASVSAILTVEHIRSRSGGPATAGYTVTGTTGTVPFLSNSRPPDDRYIPVVINPRLNTDQTDVRGELHLDLGFANVTDVAGYRWSEFSQFQNITGRPVGGSDYRGYAKYYTFSNELRISNAKGSPVNWQVGYYYFYEKQVVDSSVFGALPVGVRDQAEVFRFIYPSVLEKSHGFFGEATVPLGSGVEITGGLRYSINDKSREGDQLSLNIPLFIGSGGTSAVYTPSSVAGASSDRKLTYNAVIGWQADPDHYLFAKVSTGFKAGGFNTTNAYGPEELTAYEIGSKNRFANGVLQLNLGGFYYDYKDQQVLTVDPTTLLPTTRNAGRSRVWGIEASSVVKLSPNDRFTASVDYLNAEFTQFIASATAFGPTTITLDLAGAKPPFSPTWTIGLSYAHDFRFDWGDVTFQAQSAFKSDYYTSVFNYRPLQQEANTTTNLSLTYAAPSKAWSLLAFVNNLEDNRTLASGSFSGSGGATSYIWQFGAPRTFGVRATVNFK